MFLFRCQKQPNRPTRDYIMQDWLNFLCQYTGKVAPLVISFQVTRWFF